MNRCLKLLSKLQIKAVASPRNQRYLQPRSFGARQSVCEVDQGCKLAVKLDLKRPTLWYEADLFDEFTNTFGGFQAGILRVEGLGQVNHLVTIEFGSSPGCGSLPWR